MELRACKLLCVQLAREHGVMESYKREAKVGGTCMPGIDTSITTQILQTLPTEWVKHTISQLCLQKHINHTLADYTTLGDLLFALECWRANMQRDVALADDATQQEVLLRICYHDALRLIRRCTTTSIGFWAAQQDRSGADAGKQSCTHNRFPRVDAMEGHVTTRCPMGSRRVKAYIRVKARSVWRGCRMGESHPAGMCAEAGGGCACVGQRVCWNVQPRPGRPRA
jgi:hypothetical protein